MMSLKSEIMTTERKAQRMNVEDLTDIVIQRRSLEKLILKKVES